MTVYDAMTGEIYPVKAEYHKGDTVLERSMFDHDSLLLWLEPAGTASMVSEELLSETDNAENTENDSASEEKKCSFQLDISDQVEIVRSEPNVSILDLAEYAFDGGEWQPEEEILRIDNLFREKLGYPLRMELLHSRGPMTERKALNILCPCDSIFIQRSVGRDFSLPWKMTRKPEYSWMRSSGKPCRGWYTDHCIRKCRFRRWNPESMNWL